MGKDTTAAELRRTPGYGSTDQESAKLENDRNLEGDADLGPAPEENEPGHRPAEDQDKPTDPERWPRGPSDGDG
jgi:hypothetical protein